MKYIRSRVQNREIVYGVWCSLASSICGEIVRARAMTGCCWMWSTRRAVPRPCCRSRGCGGFSRCAVVRLPMSDRVWCKWALIWGPRASCSPTSTARPRRKRLFPSCAIRRTACAAWDLPCGPRITGGNSGRYAACAQRQLFGRHADRKPGSRGAVRGHRGRAGRGCAFVEPADLGASLELPGDFADPRFMAALWALPTRRAGTARRRASCCPRRTWPRPCGKWAIPLSAWARCRVAGASPGRQSEKPLASGKIGETPTPVQAGVVPPDGQQTPLARCLRRHRLVFRKLAGRKGTKPVAQRHGKAAPRS